MNRAFHSIPLTLALLVLVERASAADWVISAGQTVLYHTNVGPGSPGTWIDTGDLIIERGATLRVLGPGRFHVRATGRIRIDGRLDVSGGGHVSPAGVATLNTTHLHETGGHGSAGGGGGGTGNPLVGVSVAKGDDGAGGFAVANVGGKGGESGYNPSADDELRRPGGGGGGALARDQPVHANPSHASNLGLIASAGHDGAATALGALSGALVPRGGAIALLPFQDGNPRNDFYGRKLEPLSGHLIVGELLSPVAGIGGGAGGNAIRSSVFPAVWTPTGDEKGAGGGGGGGLVILEAREIVVGPQGSILSNGGHGGGGENSSLTAGITRIGGGSGGGSGGHVILQAEVIDLVAAQPNALVALGGRGGPGKANVQGAEGAGGNGGPGIIQLHPASGPLGIRLAPGVALPSRTSPDAHVLMPEVSFLSAPF